MTPLEKYILKTLKRGYTHEQIKAALVSKGHDPYHVDKYFTDIVKKLSTRNKIIYITAFLAFLFIAILLFYMTQGIRTGSNAPELILEADSLCRAGNYDKSIEMYNKYLLENEPDPDVYFYLGLCFLIRNQDADAILYFNKALELDPQNAYTYFKIAQAQCKGKDFNSAEANFNKALELDPKNALFLTAKQQCAIKKANI